jgi:4-hydroxy-tetrahydrodipicolinate reductase
VKISLVGRTGRMGTQIAALATQDPDLSLVDAHNDADVIIDFSAPAALAQSISFNKPLVIGTTGINHHELIAAAHHIPLVWAPNFSLGMAQCILLAHQLAATLTPCTIQIVETHHIHKKDAPSGTALAIAQALGGNIPIESHRVDDAIGTHTIIFTHHNERIELTHQALSREAFAMGALLAAKKIFNKPPGLYELKDLL